MGHRTKENLRVTALHKGGYFGETGLLAFSQRSSEDAELPKEVTLQTLTLPLPYL